MKYLFLSGLIFIIANLRGQIVPNYGLMASYFFTGNSLDSSGNNYHGTVFGATLTTDRFDRPNQAYYFSNSSSYIRVGDVLDNVFSGSNSKFSISLWIYPTQSNNNGVIFAKTADYIGCSEFNYGICIRLLNNKVNFSYWGNPNGGAARYVSTNYTIAKFNQWYHLVVNYNGTVSSNNGLDRVEIYVNGTQQTVYLDGNQIGANPGVIGDNAAQLGIGNYLTPSGTPCQNSTAFKGKIDDICVYNRILSQAAVDSLFNSYNANIKEWPVSYDDAASFLQLYPNPARDYVDVVFNSDGYNVLTMYDLLGKEIYSQVVQKTGECTERLNTSQLSNGTYFVKLITPLKVVSSKFVIVR